MKEEQDELEIDLRELLYVLKRNIWIILATTIIFGAAAGLYSYYFVTPQYSSTAKIYIMSNSDTTPSLSDLDVSSGLTADYIELIESRPVMEQVVTDLNINMSYKELLGYVSVTNPEDTRILYITVTYTDAVVAQQIANDIVSVATKSISSIMNTDEPSIVEDAITNDQQIYPSSKKIMGLSAIAGMMLSAGIIVFFYILDDTVKSSKDVERYLGLTTLGLIPDELDGVKNLNQRPAFTRIFRIHKEDE